VYATTTITSPTGELLLVADDEGLAAVLWQAEEPERFLPPGSAIVEGGNRWTALAAAQLAEYFAGERTEFSVPLHPRGTPFQLAVWEVLRTIPYGRTMTYGEQARAIGRPSAARAVGAANGRNPISIVVPCHRVVGSNGSLTGFAAGLDAKAWLLAHERGDVLPGFEPAIGPRAAGATMQV
jgi:methylated-DNA-[protein]-cysteine S-methyltransferase